MLDALGLAVRWATFAAILAAVGAVVFTTLILRRATVSAPMADLAPRRAATLALAGMVALLPLGLIRLAIQTAEMRFAGDPWVGVATALLTDSGWGRAWMLQVAAALLLIVAFALCRRGVRWGWMAALPLALVLAVTPTMSSHAMSGAHRDASGMIADGLHVIAAGAWLGTLAMLFAGLRVQGARVGDGDAERTRDLMVLLVRFSPAAMISVALVAASGLVSSFHHIEHPRALVDTAYGRLLLAKVCVVGVVLLLGARNWRRLTPAIATDGPRPMLRGMAAELVVAALVLLLTAALVATSPPMDAMPM